ncbi:MAG: hypothetical protein FIA97_04200 [Methylococcaceae bacterium]|nr:hypothetical protein [Methylococcaceae bacterium]
MDDAPVPELFGFTPPMVTVPSAMTQRIGRANEAIIFNPGDGGPFGELQRSTRMPDMAVLLAASASLQTEGLGSPLRNRLQERLGRRGDQKVAELGAAPDKGRDDFVGPESGGHALACHEWAQKVKRLENLAQGRKGGPESHRRAIADGSGKLEKPDSSELSGGAVSGRS